MNQLNITTYCACKFEPVSLFLRVTFYNTNIYKNSLDDIKKDMFAIIRDMSFNSAMDYIKREIKKRHMNVAIINESKNKVEYSFQGDIALNFDKLKTIIKFLDSIEVNI